MGELGDGEVGDGIGAGGFGMGEQAAQRLELGAHEPGPVQPRDRCGLVATEQGGAIRGRGGQLGTGGEREHGQDRLVRAERGAHHGHEPVDVGLTGPQRSGPQLIGRRDALGEQRGDIVGLPGQRLGVGGRRRPGRRHRPARSPRRARARSGPGSRGADSMVACASRKCGQRGVGTLAQLGIVHRAGGSAGAAGRSTGGRQIGHLQRAAAAHQSRRRTPPRR